MVIDLLLYGSNHPLVFTKLIWMDESLAWYFHIIADGCNQIYMQYLQAKTIYSVCLWKTARLQQDLSLYLGQFIAPNTTYHCVQLQTTFVSLIGALSMKVLYHWHFNWTKLQYHGRLPHFSMTFYCFNNISIYIFGSCAIRS